MFTSVRRRLGVRALIAAIFTSLLVTIPQTAQAADSIPELQWPAVQSSLYTNDTVTSPTGAVTTGCTDDNGDPVNLKTYDTTGQVVRDIDATQFVDNVQNCIREPVVDKNGDLYGKPFGQYITGGWVYNTHLLAYRGNTLKWKYATGCTSQASAPVIGADGNIYVISSINGMRLIGLTPDTAPPSTQPEKVLDIPLSGYGQCTFELFATKDGIGVINGSRRAYLYSYSGELVGSMTSGQLDRKEQINATGRAFYPVNVGSGSTASIKIVAYDLTTDMIGWTAQESLFGHNPRFDGAYSTPDGGVVVVVRRLKDIGGVPSSERVYALIKLNAFGQKSWEQDLVRQDADGDTWSNTGVVVDINGNITVTRKGSMVTANDPYTSTVGAISIGMLDAAGNVVYSEIMHGNLDKANGGVRGYTIEGAGHFVGQDTLYLLSACRNTCNEFQETKLYPIRVAGLGLDYPRGAVIMPRPPSAYIALGDSFSSGEGVEPFEADTDIPGWNKCHRSENAYARWLVAEFDAPSLGSDGFRACSGAVTENITNTAQWNEGTQLDWWPDPTTELVTVTIGGNDIGFTDFSKACVNPFSSCAVDSEAYNAALSKINNELPSSLEETYERILEYAPNATVYVVGYPQVIGNKTQGDPLDPECPYMMDGGANWSEAQAARDIVTKLNAKIQQAVSSTDSLRLSFVDANGADSPFTGHEVCGASPVSYFQNIDQASNDPAYVFHPNSFGQLAYAELIANAINAE